MFCCKKRIETMASGENGPLDGDDPLGKNKQGTRLDTFLWGSVMSSVLFSNSYLFCFGVLIPFSAIECESCVDFIVL